VTLARPPQHCLFAPLTGAG